MCQAHRMPQKWVWRVASVWNQWTRREIDNGNTHGQIDKWSGKANSNFVNPNMHVHGEYQLNMWLRILETRNTPHVLMKPTTPKPKLIWRQNLLIKPSTNLWRVLESEREGERDVDTITTSSKEKYANTKKKKKSIENQRMFKSSEAIQSDFNSESERNMEKKNKKKEEETPYCSVMEEKLKSQHG